MTLAKLREIERSAAVAMAMFQDALAQHTEGLALGRDAEALKARQYAHDSLDAYFDHMVALHG